MFIKIVDDSFFLEIINYFWLNSFNYIVLCVLEIIMIKCLFLYNEFQKKYHKINEKHVRTDKSNLYPPL